MKAEVFKEGKSFAKIIEFFKEKGFIEKSSDYIPEYLEDKTYSYFEISEDGTLLIIIEYSSEDKISDFEKELKNVFTEYMILVKDDLSEYRFYKYDPGTDKILKLRKKRSDLEAVFLKKLESIKYNNLESVEALFDRSEFIKEFYQLYCDTEGYLSRKIEGIPDDHDRELFTKIILQRMMFLWFLQKKKLLDGNENYFVEKYSQFFKAKTNFYEGFLKKLFFQGLCVKPEERSKEINDLIGDVPYLNGGLFIESEIEQKYNDSIRIPNEAFYRAMTYPIGRGERNIPVLNLLECKEWTVDERSGDVDKLNPEILGYIFEKSINKKDLGAVYTPEEITTYICKNTIHPHLLDRVNEKFSTEHKDLDTIFKEGNKDQWRYLFEVLKEVKIVDPAVGSGHFLVDAIVILEKIYHKLRDKEIIGWSNYQIREQIIINNLFGVDILEGAIEICKLRLFLALAETFRTKEDVQPLPNIDFNIRCGNSLIGFVSTDELIQNFFSQGDAVNALAKNMEFLEKHVPEVAYKAKKILSRFDIDPLDLFRLRTELIKRYRVLHDKELQPEMRKVLQDITVAFNRELNAQYYGKIQDVFKKDKNLKQLSENERYQKYIGLQPFHWVMEYSEVFENGGFDVVIGNPPYMSFTSTKAKKDKLTLDCYYFLFSNIRDIYECFIDRFDSIYRSYFSYIIPNNIITSKYTILDNLIIFENLGEKIFVGVNTSVCIFVKKKGYKNKSFVFRNYIGLENKLSALGRIESMVIKNFDFNEDNEIINYLKNKFKKLDDLNAEVRRGEERGKKSLSRDKNKILIPIYTAEQMNFFSLSETHFFINPKDLEKKFYSNDKIGLNITFRKRLKAAYIGDKVVLKSIICVYNLKKEELFNLLALFNSRLFDYYHKIRYSFFFEKRFNNIRDIHNYIYVAFPKPVQELVGILIEKYDKHLHILLDYLVYEVAFNSKIKTNLVEKVTNLLTSNIPWKSLIVHKEIQKEIEKIKSHPWVKIIEEEA